MRPRECSRLRWSSRGRHPPPQRGALEGRRNSWRQSSESRARRETWGGKEGRPNWWIQCVTTTKSPPTAEVGCSRKLRQIRCVPAAGHLSLPEKTRSGASIWYIRDVCVVCVARKLLNFCLPSKLVVPLLSVGQPFTDTTCDTTVIESRFALTQAILQEDPSPCLLKLCAHA